MIVISVLFVLQLNAAADPGDHGDAPLPYPTMDSVNGARHYPTGGPILGNIIDYENDGHPSLLADGDDLTGGPDDEDGVIFPAPLIPGITVPILVFVNGPGWLTAWIDFNGISVWEVNPTEQIASGLPLNPGLNIITVNVPPTALPNTYTFARFRFSSIQPGVLPPTGPIQGGEVEDYRVYIGQAQLFCIGGHKYSDCTNGPLEGWRIDVYDSTGANVGHDTTDSLGYWEVCGLAPGLYTATETVQNGWRSPRPWQDVMLGFNDNKSVDFYNTPILCINGTKINNCTGLGLEGWTIKLTDEFGTTLPTSTDAYGNYSFCGLRPGNYTISEEIEDGWMSVGSSSIDVELECDSNESVDFKNTPLLCINGTKINNCTGLGLPGWKIALSDANGKNLGYRITDANGKYSFCELEPGNYIVIEIGKPGYISSGPIRIEVELECESNESVDFKNIPLLCINGTKTDASTGEPLEGWTIKLTDESGKTTSNSTDADGNYSFCSLEPGDYIVCEEPKDGWKNITPSCVPVKLDCDDEVVDFENIPTSLCINGSKINNCTGEGIAEWTIELRDEAGAVINTTKTNSNGDYSFCNLEPGNYTVCEQLPGSWKNVTPLCIPVTLDTDSSENNDFANDPPVCINGTKINDCTGEPISNWKITLYDIAGNKIRENVTDANGRYSFCRLTPGRRYWVCEEIKDGWEPVKDQKESVPPFICPTCKIYCKCVDLTCEGAEIDFRNVQRSLCINGTKINNCTGEGLAGWTIYLYNASGIKIKTTQTDRNGRYSFCGLAPGVYRICEEIRDGYIPVTDINHSNSSEICAPGECENCIPVILDCDNSEGNDFENIPPLSIKGKVIDDCTGLGLKGWTVKLYDGTTQLTTRTTGADGSYTFASSTTSGGLKLTAGKLYTVCEVVQQNWTPVTYHANTSHPASNEYCIPVFLDCGETEVEDFENIPSLCIRGHEFNHCTGEGLDNWVIHLKDNAGKVLSTTTTDDAGYYEFCSLESGWYTVCEDEIPEGWTSFRDDPKSPAMALPGASAAPEDCERPKCIVVNLDNCLDSTDNDFENIPEFCIKGIVTTNNTTEVIKDFPVKIENSDGTLREIVSTDDFGEYSLCGLKAGTYTVCVAKIGWTADEPCAIVYLDCEDMDQNFDVYKGRNTLVPGITSPAIILDAPKTAVVPGAISVQPTAAIEPDMGGDEKAERQPAAPEIA